LIAFVVTIVHLAFAAFLLATGQLSLGFWELVFIAGTTALHLAYFLLLQAGYRAGDLSLVYPMARVSGPLLSTLFAVAFLNENITLQMALGAIAIIGGVLCMMGGGSMGAKTAMPSVLFGIAPGFFIGCYTVWDAYAVSVILIPPLLLDYFSTLGRCVVLVPIAWARRNSVATQ
jgi:uncharacterized membrane protein